MSGHAPCQNIDRRRSSLPSAMPTVAALAGSPPKPGLPGYEPPHEDTVIDGIIIGFLPAHKLAPARWADR